MAVALPSPWVDTGIKKDFTVSCTMRLLFLPTTAGSTLYTFSTPPPAELMGGAPTTSAWVYADADTTGIIGGNTFFDARIAGNQVKQPAEVPTGTVHLRPHDLVRPLGVGSADNYQRIVYLIAPWLPAPGWEILELVNDVDPAEPTLVYPFVATIHGMRLGVRYQTFQGGNPYFATDYELEYGWFLDGFSTLYVACAGFSVGVPTAPILYFSGTVGAGSWLFTQDTAQVPSRISTAGQILVRGHGTVDDGVHAQIQFREIRSEAELMDTADVNEDRPIYQYVHSAGPGGLDIRAPQGQVAEDFMQAPYRFNYDLGISKHGTDNTNAQIWDDFVVPTQIHGPSGTDKTPQAANLVEPYTASYVAQITGHTRRTKEFTNPISFSINPTWMNTQPVPWSVEDFQIPIQGTPARHHPTGPGGVQDVPHIGYNPLLINIPPFVDVHRPAGYTPWMAQDANASVVETATETQITVGTAGALVKRTFFTHWHDWVGLGIGGKTNPQFQVEAYEITKHDYFEQAGDVWAFQHHGYLQMVIAAPVGSDGDLTLRIDGNHVDVTDNHSSDPAARAAALTVTLTPYNRSYTLLVAPGMNTLTFPLCFPEEGGPFYHGRVASLQMVMPAQGVWTITQLRLVIPVGSKALYKNDYGPPARETPGRDYSHFGFVLSGAFTQGNRPDKTFKADETGERGGFSRYIRLENSTHLLIQDTATDINKLEGFSGQYLAPNYLEANRDEFGRELGPELAQWQRPTVPYYNLNDVPLPGAGFQPPCDIVCGRLRIVNGFQFRVQVNWNGGHGSLEGLIAGSDGRPVGAGVTVTARRVDNNAPAGSAATDGDSYVVITPVPANGLVEYRLEVIP